MRDLIIIAIRAELERQGAVYSDDPTHVVAGVKLDLGAMADAVTRTLIEQMPIHAPIQVLVDRLSAIADAMEHALDHPPDPDAKVEFIKPEPAIECTPAERTALRSVASKPQGYLVVLYGSDAEWGGQGLAGGRASANDLVARGLLSKGGERGGITYFITPLGLRAIEQEPL